ncbi:pyridoxal-phosphate dependent enzyme [Chitinophaga sp. Hz27]|uniref:pyridoxal-phosphate dependent enzyme n=1 Tax=Chitinophaga sp. Hz27 TaxID=3347169 RepID=UPI0035D54CF7
MKHISLFNQESPMEELPQTASMLGLGKLFVKRDDMLTPEFGGCKVRNLNRQFTHALENGADTLLMAARVGSNAVAAASLFAKKYGLRVSAILKPQVVSYTCRFNLEIIAAAGTEIIPVPAGTLLHSKSPTVTREMTRLTSEGRRPQFVGFGGGDIQAALAQASAVKEMWMQIKSNGIEELEKIYVAGASFSTAAGMAAGLSLLGIKSKLVIVGLAHEDAPDDHFFNKANEAAKLANVEWGNTTDHNMPIDAPQFHCAFKEAFGEITEPLQIESLDEVKALQLDPVYTRKAFSYMMQDAGQHAGKNCLFWHTGNSRPWPEYLIRPELEATLSALLI